MLLQSEEIIEFGRQARESREENQIETTLRTPFASDGRERYLLKRAQEFQSEYPHITQNLLASYLGHDRRRLAWDEARGGSGRGRDRELDRLILSKQMRRSNARATSAYVQRFCQLNKFDTRRIRTAQKNGDLEPNTRVRARLGCLYAVCGIHLLQSEVHADSTQALVQRSRLVASVKDFIKKVRRFFSTD